MVQEDFKRSSEVGEPYTLTKCRPSAWAVYLHASLVWVRVYASRTLTLARTGEIRPPIDGELEVGR